MRFTQLGGLAAFAGLSQAFLIPPTIATADSKVVDVVSNAIEALDTRVMDVDCPGCPVAGTAGVLHHAQSVLRFNISIENVNDKPDHLLVNGLQVFPIDSQAVTTPLFADQLIKKPDGTWGYSSSPELGYSMSVKPFHDGKQQLSVYGIRLRVIEVGATFVHGIPAIELKILQTPTGKLMVASGQLNSGRPGRPNSASEPKCPSLLCHWKAIIADKVDALKKGCGGRKGGPYRIARPHGTYGERPEGHRRPEGHPHPYHHRRPRHGFFGRFIRNVTLHIFVPILVGVALGITASIVGMIVGHIAIFFWRLFFRRGERGQYCRVKPEEAVEGADEEGKGFLENQVPPPVYEDEAVVVDEKTEQT